MAGNGRYILHIKGVQYPFYFNVPACEEFTKRLNVNKGDNSFKTIVDLVYCGISGYAISSNLPHPTYGDAYAIVSEIYLLPDRDDIIKSITDVFSDSKKTDTGGENGGEENKEEGDLINYWDNVRRYCLGFIGMTENEYNNTTYSNLMLKVGGFNDRVKVNISMKRHLSWITYIAPHLNPKKMAKTIDEFWPLASDSEGSKKKIDDAKRVRIQEFLSQRNGRNNHND